MDTVKIGRKKTNALKVELNERGEYIWITPDDATLPDRFVKEFKHISDWGDSIPSKLGEIEKKYEGKEDFRDILMKTSEMSDVNVQFSEEAIRVIDGIFGADTVKKYFCESYEQNSNFLPDSECVMEFFENISPVLEKVFNRKIELQRKASRERMAKYVPQDHKRPKRGAAK